MPFNWMNLPGYLTVFVIQSIMVWHNLCFTACLVTFGIGVFLFVITVTEDIKSSLRQINTKAKRNKHQLDANKELSQFIECFSVAKQLSSKNVFGLTSWDSNLTFFFTILLQFDNQLFGRIRCNDDASLIFMVHR